VRYLLLSFLLAVVACCDPLPIRPDPKLTPGAILTTDVSKVCVPNYSQSVRHTSDSLKQKIYRKYRINPKAGKYEVDHRVPLGLGGADVESNLWIQSYLTSLWNAHTKDWLEDYVHARVCHNHSMTLVEGQAVFLGDWIAAYKKFHVR
jgi:hypothetical protein